jgi:tmRNA-binding protein
MIIDKDKNGNISVSEMTIEETKILIVALDLYFNINPANCRTNDERKMILMKSQLENLTKQ